MPGGTTPAIEGPAVIMSGISAVCVCVRVRERERDREYNEYMYFTSVHTTLQTCTNV